MVVTLPSETWPSLEEARADALAWLDEQRRLDYFRRAGGKPRHGRNSMYTYHGCRCADCCAAHRLAARTKEKVTA